LSDLRSVCKKTELSGHILWKLSLPLVTAAGKARNERKDSKTMDTTSGTTNPTQNGSQDQTSSASKAQQAVKAVIDGIRQIAAAAASSHK